MIKKIGKVMILAIMALLFFTLPTFAREMKVEELEEYIDNNEKYSSVRTLYIIGNYIFTSDYDVNTKDIMLGATSISLDPARDGDENQRYVNGTGAYNKMEIFQINRIISGGEAKGWNIADSYVKGSTTLTKDMKINVKFIDYEYVKDVYTITFKDSEGSNPDKTVSVLEGDKVIAPTEGFTRDGYKLMGWYTTDQATLFDFASTPITGNIELHAKWAELPKASLTDFPDTVKIDDAAKEFGVKMDQSNDFENKMVYGHFSITRNGEDARNLADIQYYETGNGVKDWLPLEGNDFGPKDTGFPVKANLESKFKVSFKEVGTYHIVIEVRDKATNEAYITIEKDITVNPVEVDTDSIVQNAEGKLTEIFFTSTRNL